MNENKKQQLLDSELLKNIHFHNIERVEELLLAGANIEAKTVLGLSPLLLAVDKGNIEMAELLIEFNADLNASINGYTPLLLAINKGNIEMARLLIDMDADLDVSINSYSPLHLAVELENLAMVDLLVTRGANTEIKTNYGYTPLYLAIEKQNFEIMDYLLKNKANLEEKTEEHYTALYIGIRTGNKEIVDFLLKAGADIEAKTIDGDTPLLFAIKIRDYELMEVLLKAGADIEAKAIDGLNSLFIAVQEGNLEVLTILLKAGANFFSENNIQVSAFSAAEEQFGAEKIQEVIADRLQDIFVTYEMEFELLEKRIFNLAKASNNYNNIILTNLLFCRKKEDSLQGLINKRILSDAGFSQHPLLKSIQEASKVATPNSQLESNFKITVKNFNKKMEQQFNENLNSLQMVLSEEVSENLISLKETENSPLLLKTNCEESLSQNDCEDSSFS